MYDRILVPLDGSPFAEQVLPFAAALARTAHMTLELLAVRPAAPAGAVEDASVAVPGDAAHERAAHERAAVKARLQRAAAALADAGAPPVVTTVVDAASVPEAIARHAAHARAAMLVMTTHGNAGLLRTPRGNVAEGVLRGATLPVLLWRPTQAPGPLPRRFGHVLVPLDGSTRAEMVLPHAATMATLFDARLTLVRVVPQATARAEPGAAGAAAAPTAWGEPAAAVLDRAATGRAVERARSYLAHVTARVRADFPGVNVATRAVLDARPAATIARLAVELGADLVAMTTYGQGASRLVVGSTAEAVMRRRGGATLLVRPTIAVDTP